MTKTSFKNSEKIYTPEVEILDTPLSYMPLRSKDFTLCIVYKVHSGLSDALGNLNRQLLLTRLSFTVRLVGGPGSHEGRLEVYYSSRYISSWGTVCEDYFNDTAASVVCRSLGYRYVL